MEEICDDLRTVFQSEIDSHRQSLVDRGISVGEIEYEVWNSTPGSYTSEVRVSFYRKGDVIDVFEFHLFRNGKQVVQANEIKTWVQQNIGGVGT
jgi:hypothetical protein